MQKASDRRRVMRNVPVRNMAEKRGESDILSKRSEFRNKHKSAEKETRALASMCPGSTGIMGSWKPKKLR